MQVRHLPPRFNALVDVVQEGAAGHGAASTLGRMQIAIFQHDLALADDHRRSPAQLHALEAVVLCSRLVVLGRDVLTASGSQITRSLSEPTDVLPLRGHRLKILAAFVLVTATNWFSSIFPVATALSQMTDVRSSTLLVPSGVAVKLSFPMLSRQR